jgi:FMN reductase
MTTIALLCGGQAPDTRPAVLFGVAERLLSEAGHTVRTINVRDLPTVSLLSADRNCPTVRKAIDTLRDADGIVVATQIHRASSSGLVRSVLDLLPKSTLAGKTVFPLAIGGIQGQLIALDYTLRPLLTARGASRVLGGHFVPERFVGSTAEGANIDPRAADALRTALLTFSAELDKVSRRRAQRALVS